MSSWTEDPVREPPIPAVAVVTAFLVAVYVCKVAFDLLSYLLAVGMSPLLPG